MHRKVCIYKYPIQHTLVICASRETQPNGFFLTLRRKGGHGPRDCPLQAVHIPPPLSCLSLLLLSLTNFEASKGAGILKVDTLSYVKCQQQLFQIPGVPFLWCRVSSLCLSFALI